MTHYKLNIYTYHCLAYRLPECSLHPLPGLCPIVCKVTSYLHYGSARQNVTNYLKKMKLAAVPIPIHDIITGLEMLTTCQFSLKYLCLFFPSTLQPPAELTRN